MTLRRLVLWRHGETDYNAASRMQGQLDSQLTETGRRQALRAAGELAATERPDVLLSSDLARAVDTASVLAELTGLELQIDKRLRETHLGQWQGLTHAEVEASEPGMLAVWRADAQHAPPGGETRVQVAGRGAQVIEELDEAGPRVAVLCTHGGLITGLTGLLLGLPPARWSVFGRLGNGRWSVLFRTGSQWRMESYNTAGPS